VLNAHGDTFNAAMIIHAMRYFSADIFNNVTSFEGLIIKILYLKLSYYFPKYDSIFSVDFVKRALLMYY